jgi:adenylate cyclase
MAVEIERKFLVRDGSWRTATDAGIAIRQGYLSTDPGRVVRVRLAGDRGALTVKGPTNAATRLEFEYAIPAADAGRMLDDLCVPPLLEKTRYRIRCGRHVWEIDEFFGDNAGLVVAEIELTDAGEAFERPGWVGDEVTGDPRYFNSNLVAAPFSTWRPRS